MAGGKGKNRHDATGRSRTATFVMLYDTLVTSAPWAAASGGAIKLLVHLTLLSKGNNGYGHKGEDGRLFLSERQAGLAIGVARNTASKLFAELHDLGFIRVVEAGHFNVKVRTATRWRLTFQPTPWNSRPATNEWRSWTPEQNTRAQILSGTGPIIEPTPTPTGANTGPVPVVPRSADPITLTGANTGPDIDIPRQGLVGVEPKPRVDPPACPKIAGGIFPHPVDADPEAIAHRNVAAWWSAADKAARTALADRHKVKPEEVDRYVAGTAHLPFVKATALHLACQRMTRRAA